MNGAESLARTLVAGGINVCFTNPGTSEMHFVAALDKVNGIRCVLGLFEGVVTGAADGYWRMADKPAATLLHLGPGLGNGLANLHNARKAASGIVNIVGEHATYHVKHDAPLTSDIEGIARPVSAWVRTSPSARAVAADGAAAIVAARTPPGQVATLILPADTAWNDADGVAPVPPAPARVVVGADAIGAREALAAAVGAKKNGEVVQPPGRPALPTGALTPDTLAAALGALLPEGAIVSDESVTSDRGFFKATAGAPPHDWMNNMGGSIGLGLPLATGAAVACPDRKVVCLEGDGSGMYTLQALWTQAREGLDVTTVVFANRTYAILRHELSGVRAGTPGPKAADMLDIGRPDLDWVALARGMGVPASRATTAEEFNKQFAAGLATSGPYLVEAVL